MSTAAALRATGLAKRFGPLAALAPLDLALAPGETLAVLGPNGAGKTTLLRLLAGLMRPSAGEISFGARSESRAQRRARVGLVAHATFLTPQLTARENLVFAARLYGVASPGARAAELIAAHELGSFAERRAGELSRGMAQRVAIARALVHDPALLLLDEPFTGLDPRAAEKLAARLAAQRGSARACVLVTHELARAVELATHAVVLVRGRARSVDSSALASAQQLEAAYKVAVAALEAVP
jgi:heme exporter protein A